MYKFAIINTFIWRDRWDLGFVGLNVWITSDFLRFKVYQFWSFKLFYMCFHILARMQSVFNRTLRLHTRIYYRCNNTFAEFIIFIARSPIFLYTRYMFTSWMCKIRIIFILAILGIKWHNRKRKIAFLFIVFLGNVAVVFVCTTVNSSNTIPPYPFFWAIPFPLNALPLRC